MRISGKEFKSNERYNYTAREYLLKRVEILASKLESERIHCCVEQSNKSEAVYLDISNTNSYESCKISFRNHNNWGNSEYDFVVWLSRFDTWTEVKKHFMSEILPEILNKLEVRKC